MKPVIVLYGKSKSGKSTSKDHILTTYSSEIDRLVAYTSRDKRPGEVDGIDYHFKSKSAANSICEGLKKEGKLFTYAEFNGNKYFTSFDDLSKNYISDNNSIKRKISIMDVEDNGVEQLLDFAKKGEIKPIFIKLKRDNIEECSRTKRDTGHYFLEDKLFNYVIDNNGSMEELYDKLDVVIDDILLEN